MSYSADDLNAQVAELTEAVRTLTLELHRARDTSVSLLKPKELAALWRYSDSTVYELIAKGVIPTVRIDDGTVRIPLVAAQAVIAKALGGRTDVDSDMVARILNGE